MPASQQKYTGPSVTALRDRMGHHMQKVFLGMAVVLALGMVAMFSGSNSGLNAPDKSVVGTSTVMAQVEGTDIKSADVARIADQGSSGSSDPRSKIQTQSYVLSSLSDVAIKTAAAKKAGLTITDSELKTEMDRIFKEASGTQFAGLSDADKKKYEGRLRDQLESNKTQVADSLLVKKWEDTFKAKININDPKTPPSDIEVRARHILIKVIDPKAPEPKKGADAKDKPLPDAEAKKEAVRILTEAKKPKADFAALAKKYSMDTGSGANGGDLDWFGQGRMVPAFDKAAFSMKPGQISDLVKTNFGYHIIKLEDRRASAQAAQKLVSDYMEKARKTAKVTINDDAMAGLKALNEVGPPTAKPAEKAPHYKDAETHLQKAVAHDASNAGLIALLGDVYRRQYMEDKKKNEGMRKKAIAQYESAVKINPAPRLRTDLADLYQDEGKKTEALDQYKKAAEFAFADPSVRYTLQDAFKKLGQPALADQQKKLIDEANKNRPGGGMNFPINVK